MNPTVKLSRLKGIIKRYGSCVIAFSGGVDSSFLLRVASQVLPPDKLLAVTADSATYPKDELLFSRKIASQWGIRHKVIKTGELKNKSFVSNPQDRCYFCKRELFSELNKIARRQGLSFVLDASNLSDNSDFRPGNKAKKEFGVRSPLIEAGFSKGDIRKISRKLGLPTWDKPALACLASRVPYGKRITTRLLRRINAAETYLKDLGFKQSRVRDYGDTCRIEVLKAKIGSLLAKREHIINKFKNIGYNYITLDLEGYRTGSLNEVLMR